MNRLLALLLFVCCFGVAQAQNGSKIPPMDKSPMDMSYYPVNYPILKIQDKATEPLVSRIVYSRPQKNGRVVFGELVEFGKVWRLGANEATEIEFFKDVKIGTSKLKKGRYTMYAIPYENKWTVIFNKDLDTWGAFKYDQKKDALRYDVNVERIADPEEAFGAYFDKAANGATLNIVWDNVRASIPISYQ